MKTNPTDLCEASNAEKQPTTTVDKKPNGKSQIRYMKRITFDASCALLFAAALSLIPSHLGFAQDVVVTPKTTDAVSTTTSGNITRITPGAISIQAEGEAHPLAYNITANTKFVDDQNAPVEMQNVKTGRAVIIYYVMEGENRVATKVVLRNAP